MLKRLAAVSVIALAGCTTVATEDGGGVVQQFNGSTVTIRGGFTVGQTAAPTPRMVQQAKEVCNGATYLSATRDPDSLDFFLYLFKC